MRHPFTPQLPLGATPMAEIEFDYGSRHELVPILMALQHLYMNCSPVVEDILSLIAGDISPGRELINRGKRPNPIEFGYRVLIVEDRAGLKPVDFSGQQPSESRAPDWFFPTMLLS